MKTLILAVALTIGTAAIAKNDDLPHQSGGMIPYDSVQRVFVFSDSRHWFDTEGRILVCPFTHSVWERNDNSGRDCFIDGMKDSRGGWTDIEKLAPAGTVLKGVEYKLTRYNKILFVYYGKPVEQKRPAPDSKLTTIKIDELKIHADRVKIERRKK